MPTVKYTEDEHIEEIVRYATVYGNLKILAANADRMLDPSTPVDEKRLFMKSYRDVTANYEELRQNRDTLKQRVFCGVSNKLFDGGKGINILALSAKGERLELQLRKAQREADTNSH